ncbi:MAG: PilN domain-containing protein [Candidatus Gottesmanbacteria bacterium]
MPATPNISINLLGSLQQEMSPLGRMITWVTTYGRYIMVTTEMIVLIAFISRFSLDRQLTDLNDEIFQKQEIITANQDLEINFRRAQDALGKIKILLAQQPTSTQAIRAIHTLLPQGTYFQNLSISDGKISSQVTSLTVQSFSQFLLNLSASRAITNVEVGTVDKATAIGIQYTVTAQLAGAQVKK